ncbi:MAG: hypothetical protein AMJ81_04845 [Phycisphaerae bacterium SM23_33]|nr:MAG: hypothetical protein AMJ81_04845 [Phycisphaerae bacterium SM23_33]
MDDPNGMGGDWQGRRAYLSQPINAIAVDIEFCVYAPGQFERSYPGLDPSGGAHYVYAYEIFNDLDPHPSPSPGYVERFSVGLDTDEQAANIGFIDGAGQNPNTWGLGPQTAGWNFNDPTLSHPSVSDVLLFTSRFGPELDTATVSGSYALAATEYLPSPLPEPAALSLLAAGAVLVAARRRRRT